MYRIARYAKLPIAFCCLEPIPFEVDGRSKALDLTSLELKKWLASFAAADGRFDEAVYAKFRALGYHMSSEARAG